MNPKDLPNPRPEPRSLGGWLSSARSTLKKKLPAEPLSSLYALTAYVLKRPPHFGISHPEYLLTETDRDRLDSLLAQLTNGTPLPYITGKQEFFGLEFEITPDVLIPRPETELLVSQAVDWLKSHPNRRRCLDVGTGSGCIAVSVCANVPDARFVITDKSFPALQTAKKNIEKHEMGSRISLAQMDLLQGLSAQFDCLCANLPYIPSGRLPELAVSRQEPLTALDGGEKGLDLIERLIHQSTRLVKSGGLILLEIDCSQPEAVIELAGIYFPDAEVRIENDLAGLPRTVIIQLRE